MNAAITNGRPRKSLGDQIDRLETTLAQFDTMLDGLADGLQNTIADAVGSAVVTAVTTAVQTTLSELLRQPELFARAGLAVPPPEARRSWLSRLAQGVRNGIRSFFRGIQTLLQAGVKTVGHGVRQLTLLWALRRKLGLALGWGAMTAVVGYLAAPWLTAAFSGFGAVCAALIAQAKRPVCQLLNTLATD